MKAYRWGDNDVYWGPFTFSRDKTYRAIAIEINSGDDEDGWEGCRLMVNAFGCTFISALPQIIPPHRRKVHAGWDAATVERLGRDWYYDTHPRVYGFSITGSGRVGQSATSYDHLSVYYGPRTHDSATDHRKGWFFPWKSWRHVRHSLYGLDGQLHGHMPTGSFFERIDEEEALQASCPSAIFSFADFDGERLTASCRIEEREWHRGEGRFKWMSAFWRPMIHRSLDIQFSGETGKRKGSWKGGTIGHSISMTPGELHESAFRRYCTEHGMQFIGVAEASNANA